jgi:hypothetical protein
VCAAFRDPGLQKSILLTSPTDSGKRSPGFPEVFDAVLRKWDAGKRGAYTQDSE